MHSYQHNTCTHSHRQHRYTPSITSYLVSKKVFVVCTEQAFVWIIKQFLLFCLVARKFEQQQQQGQAESVQLSMEWEQEGIALLFLQGVCIWIEKDLNDCHDQIFYSEMDVTPVLLLPSWLLGRDTRFQFTLSSPWLIMWSTNSQMDGEEPGMFMGLW